MNKTLNGYLMYEARVKPHIKELVDRVDDLTDADIEAADVPLPWFRIALKEYRDFRKQEAPVEIEVDSNPMGTLVEWTAPTDFIKTTKRLEVEVSPGMLFWRPDTGGVWFEAIFSKVVDPKLFSQRPVARIHKSEYLAAYKARLEKLVK